MSAFIPLKKLNTRYIPTVWFDFYR